MPIEIVNRAIAYGADSVTFRPSSDMAGSSITRAGDEERSLFDRRAG